MADILLDAHGEWDPASKPAYALVPKSSKLLFFSENLKLFMDSDQARSQLLKAEPSQVVEGFKWAQNFTVSPVDEDSYLTPDGMVRKTVASEMLLCTSDKCGQSGWHDSGVCTGLFADPEYQNANIYFVACRFVKLEEAGDLKYYAETGVNQRQTNVGYESGGNISHEIANSTVDALLDKAADADSGEAAAKVVSDAKSGLSESAEAMVDRRIEERAEGWQLDKALEHVEGLTTEDEAEDFLNEAKAEMEGANLQSVIDSIESKFQA